jgi:hypothetical protein
MSLLPWLSLLAAAVGATFLLMKCWKRASRT